MALVKFSEVSKYLKKEFYFNNLKRQLSKDFNDASFDEELQLISLEKSDLLLSLVKRFLNQVFDLDSGLFFRLMYRVDLPEVAIPKQILGEEIDFENLGLLVLKRELLKIVLREKYSS
jgi:hypothetical protein